MCAVIANEGIQELEKQRKKLPVQQAAGSDHVTKTGCPLVVGATLDLTLLGSQQALCI